MPLICEFFKRGTCRFGNRCRNSHNLSSSSDAYKELKDNPTQIVDTTTTKPQQKSHDFNENENSSLKIKSGTLTDTNQLSGDTTKGDEVSELLKKLSLAEMEIKTLNQKLQDKCKRDTNDSLLYDTNLRCSICYELFIQPAVLNCSHTFCDWCITSWLSANYSCPICRERVFSVLNCWNFEHFIQKIVELGPTEIKESYELLKEKRISEGPKIITLDDDENENEWTTENDDPFYDYYVI